MTQDFWRHGFVLRHGWLGASECDAYVAAVESHERSFGLPHIERACTGRSLDYKVVDGTRIDSALPDIDLLAVRLLAELKDICGQELVPISDPVAARNVNVTPPGGSYRWHYDRNAVTALVYLNEVQGGEMELFPNYRLLLPGGHRRRLQRVLDLLLRLPFVRVTFGSRCLIPPRKGSLLILRGDRSLHSVRRVGGCRDRIALVFGCEVPGRDLSRLTLNKYLYETAEVRGDPNYQPPIESSQVIVHRGDKDAHRQHSRAV
jgi:2OG-Fe(II) oxygenase superfamily